MATPTIEPPLTDEAEVPAEARKEGADGMRTPKRLEKHEQADITKLLGHCGFRVFTLGVRRRAGDYQGTMQSHGLPDLYAMDMKGRLGSLWIEVKARGGRMSPAQETFQTLCHQNGIPHIVGGLDDVLVWCIKYGLVKPDRHLPREQEPS